MPCYKVLISLMRGYHALSFPEFQATKAEWKLKKRLACLFGWCSSNFFWTKWTLTIEKWKYVGQCHFRIESKHQRWSSWSPSRPTFGCFDSMEVKSRFVLKMAFWILTKIYIYMILYQQLPEIYLIWSISQWIWFFCCLGWFTLQKCHISTFWILELLEKGGLYVLLATRPSSKIFRVGYE